MAFAVSSMKSATQRREALPRLTLSDALEVGKGVEDNGSWTWTPRCVMMSGSSTGYVEDCFWAAAGPHTVTLKLDPIAYDMFKRLYQRYFEGVEYSGYSMYTPYNDELMTVRMKMYDVRVSVGGTFSSPSSKEEFMATCSGKSFDVHFAFGKLWKWDQQSQVGMSTTIRLLKSD